MHRQPANLLIVFGLVVLSACQPAERRPQTAYEFASIDATVLSRDVKVPVTYVHPLASGDELFPLVVMAHGHGGSRNEAGGFVQVAERLAALGIASIRMDFPGCGDSVESFANNNLTNMLKDMVASRDHALSQPNIDASRIGLLGYSMGGRLALLTAAGDKAYTVLATWAPAARNGAGRIIDFVGGQENYKALKAQAESNGFAPFTTYWGQHQKLGTQFFADLENSRPMDAAAEFTGPLLVLYGTEDEIILPAIPEGVIAAATNSSEVVRHVIEGANHGLGLYTNEPAYAVDAVETTVNFLAERL